MHTNRSQQETDANMENKTESTTYTEQKNGEEYRYDTKSIPALSVRGAILLPK